MLKKIVSAHEHLGCSRLYFENGTYAEYDARPVELRNDLFDLINYCAPETLGCIIYPQMPYRQYHFSKEYIEATSEQINDAFFSMIDFDSEIKWYPFLYLRITDDWKTNEAIIKTYGNKAYGIKLHPDAELAASDDFIKSKVFDLAETYNKPVTIHCARPGRGMDLGVIYDNLIDTMAGRSVGINLAHVGFLHRYMLEKEFPDNIYFDLSPIGIVEDNLNHVDVEMDSFDNLITGILRKHGQRLMYGGDFPYNLQKWEDGSIHGRSRTEDLSVLFGLLEKTGVNPEDIFYNNVCHFIKMDKWK